MWENNAMNNIEVTIFRGYLNVNTSGRFSESRTFLTVLMFLMF